MDILGILNFALSVVIGLFILVLLVVLHELGHALVARRNGVVVEEFGIGFPPQAKAWNVPKSFLGDNVTYSVNWLPLGGFVKLQGEHDAASGPGDYGAATLWAKTKILLAGVAVNWITAAALLSILALFGLPKIIPNQFQLPSDTIVTRQPVFAGEVSKGLPAEQAGVQNGDRLISFAGTELEDSAQLSSLSKANSGKTVRLVYERDGHERSVDVALRADNSDGMGYLGINANQTKRTTYRSTWSAPIVGVALTGQFTAFTLSSLGDMAVNFTSGIVNKLSFSSDNRAAGDAQLAAVSNNVGGPVAILGVLFPSARADGIGSLLLVSALVSLTLAVMNLLPIPALDGGRWFVTMLYRVVLRRPLTQETEERIHGTGFMLLLGLIVLITIADIGKLF